MGPGYVNAGDLHGLCHMDFVVFSESEVITSKDARFEFFEQTYFSSPCGQSSLCVGMQTFFKSGEAVICAIMTFEVFQRFRHEYH